MDLGLRVSGSVASDGFDGAAFLSFLAQSFFVRRLRLLFHERIAAALISVKIARCRLPAQVAVDALRVHVERAGRIVRIFIGFICHSLLLETRRVTRKSSSCQ